MSDEALRSWVSARGREDDGFWIFLGRYALAEGRLAVLLRCFPERASQFDACREAEPQVAAAGNPKDHDFLAGFRERLLAATPKVEG